MTEKEARAFLSFPENIENIEDWYDVYLFQEKEYFRAKPISEKLFKKRFIKIAHADECFLCLGFQSQDEEINRIECEFGLEIKLNFNHYQHVKSKILQSIFSTRSLLTLIELAKNLLEVEKKYADSWSHVEINSNSLITPDPMEVLKDIHKLELLGITEVNQFIPENHPDLISINAEINRLVRVNH